MMAWRREGVPGEGPDAAIELDRSVAASDNRIHRYRWGYHHRQSAASKCDGANIELGADLSDISIQSKRDDLIKNAATYPAIPDLLSHHAQTAPGRAAILAPGRDPMTYGELWKQAGAVVDTLRGLGIGRTDRVAVVLPGGPEAAVAMISVAACSVCVPLNPGLTEDEYRRYFGELRLAMLLTSAETNPASRRVAQA